MYVCMYVFVCVCVCVWGRLAKPVLPSLCLHRVNFNLWGPRSTTDDPDWNMSLWVSTLTWNQTDTWPWILTDACGLRHRDMYRHPHAYKTLTDMDIESHTRHNQKHLFNVQSTHRTQTIQQAHKGAFNDAQNPHSSQSCVSLSSCTQAVLTLNKHFST